jgi:predicted small secreted protein
VKWILAVVVLMLAVVGCSGPGGPVERAGRSVDNAVYDVGTGIKKAGQKIQRAAE